MKDKEKYSPGPWSVTTGIMPNSGGRLIVEDFGGRSVCATSARGVDGNVKRMEANAKLIAAAPDMLEVLRWLDNEMACRDDEFGGCLFSMADFKKVKSAINKAMNS